MKLISLFVCIIMILCSIPTTLPEDPLLNCFRCSKDFSDPYCVNYRGDPCPSDWFCYKIKLKSIGVSKGCTPLKNYCEHYADRIGPIIHECYACKKDYCNCANETKLFYCLLLFGVIISRLSV